MARDAIQQMVRGVEADIRAEIANLRLRLAPEKLGNLDLELTVDHGVLAARFVTQSERVRALIESALPDLRQHLEEQGVQIDRLDVSVGEQRERGGRDDPAPRERRVSGVMTRKSPSKAIVPDRGMEAAPLVRTGVDLLV